MSKANSLMSKFGANIAQTVGQRPGPPPALANLAPDKFEGAIKSRSFAEMPVDSIVCAPQPRTEFDEAELRRLADSIKRFGQLAPIRVRHDAERNVWVVLIGERRLRACRLAGLDRVRVEFVERAMTEADVLAEQVVENAVRADLQPVEQARAFERLMALNGWTAQQVAESLGVEPTTVYRSLGLLRLPEDVAARVDAGEIKATAAYEISKLQIADEQRELAQRVVAEGLDHKATAAEVTQRRKARASGQGKSNGKISGKGKGRLPAEQRFRGTHGVRVIIQTTGKHSLADVAADLREIAERLDAQAADAA
jgi:ParB family chromosome partitioning protein